MIHGNVPPLRRLRPFPLIAVLMASWYNRSYAIADPEGHFASGRAEDATLPQANRAVHSDEHLTWNRPRNSGD